MTTTVLTFAQQAAPGWPDWLMGALTVAFIFVCVILVLTVLIQKPQGGGLAGAFGGAAGSGQTAFGTKTGDALTVLTIIVFTIFIIFAIVLNLGVKAAHSGLAGVPAATPANGTAPVDSTTPATDQPAPALPPTQPAATPDSAPVQPAPGTPTETPVLPPAEPAPAPVVPPSEPTPTPTPVPPGR